MWKRKATVGIAHVWNVICRTCRPSMHGEKNQPLSHMNLLHWKNIKEQPAVIPYRQ
jgi:hypothetical protein